MQELIDQLLYFLRGIWRYRWAAMVVGWVVCLLGWSVLAALPDVYEAKARVYVDTSSEISRLLDEQILDPNIQEELAYVRQAMLGRLQLEKVAEQTDLLLDAKTLEERDGVIDGLAAGIQIVSSGGNRRGGIPDNLYQITYRNADPTKAASIVRTVLNNFIEDTLGGQQSSSEVSRKFLLEQIEEYELRLQTAEQHLADFNRENYDRLPGQQGGYFERLQSEIAALETTEQTLAQVRSKLERQEQQLRGEAPRVLEGGAIDPNSLEGRIQQHRVRLDELLLRYTDSHPDVVAVRETLNRLEAQQVEANDPDAQGPVEASNNPVYQALQIAINETQAEAATLEADRETRGRRIEELRNLIDEIADVEAQSARLNRDYGVVQAQYQALIDSLERERLSREALMSEKVEFRIIDPPKTAPDPVAPMRIAFVPAILIAGIGAGLAFALLLSQVKPIIESPRWLEQNFGMPVLGTIQMDQDRVPHSVWKGLTLFLTCGGMLVVLFGVVFVIEGLGDGFRSLM